MLRQAQQADLQLIELVEMRRCILQLNFDYLLNALLKRRLTFQQLNSHHNSNEKTL